MRARGVGVSSLVVAALVAGTTVARADRNRPPSIHGTPAAWFGPEGMRVRHGKEVRFRVTAQDPDGDEVTLSVEDLPEGATFDHDLHELSWTPPREAIGTRRIKVRASDGQGSNVVVATVHVGDNRPPRIKPPPRRRTRSGEPVARPGPLVLAVDDDGDPLTYEAVRLPPGARLDPATGELHWTPTDAQAGVHRIALRVSDGELVSEVVEFTIEVAEEWTSRLLPGLYLATYLPADEPTHGVYRGIAMELVLVAWIHRNENVGPSHGRISLRGQVLSSTRDGAPTTLLYGLGFDLSIERNPRRRWLLPYFGAEVGGLIQDELGHLFQTTPAVGLHLYATRNVDVRASAGYVIVPQELEALRGWHVTVGCNLTLW